MAPRKKTAVDMDLGVPGLAGFMTALNPVASKAMSDMLAENARFMTERVNATVALQKEMMACRSPAEAMELQSAFVKDAVEACSAEMARYTERMMASFGAIAQDAKSGHRRAYNDVPV